MLGVLHLSYHVPVGNARDKKTILQVIWLWIEAVTTGRMYGILTKETARERNGQRAADAEETELIQIGNHVTTSKGYRAMGQIEEALGGNTFAFFTRNPRSGRKKEPDAADVQGLREFLEEKQFGRLVAHAPYTMNVCAAKEDIREFSREMLAWDLQLMEQLPGNFYNFHPGCHVGQGAKAGIAMIADALNAAIRPEQSTIVLLETMAGKGSEVGGRFEELREILDRVTCADRIGVCLDTCHVWDAGYDLVRRPDEVLAEFDRIIGLERLYAVHFNDSMNDCGSHKDRHQKLGEGKIGLETMKQIALHPALQGRPFILETPNDDAGYAKEITLIKSWMEKSGSKEYIR